MLRADTPIFARLATGDHPVLAKDKIFIYTIAPGFVATDRVKNLITDEVKAQSPLNRVATPEEVAETALWLALGDNEFLTGCIIDVNGASYLRS